MTSSNMQSAPLHESAKDQHVHSHTAREWLDSTPERRWPRVAILVAALLWTLGAVALALLSVAAHSTPAFPQDGPIDTAMLRWQNTPLGALAELGANVNWPLPSAIMLALVFATLLILRLYREAICTAVASFGSDLVNITLNGVVARPRPGDTVLPTSLGLNSHSFPSGHAAHTLAFYGFLLYLSLRASRHAPQWRGWLYAIDVLCVYLIVSVGPGRILERGHWPSDVLAGYLVGALTLTIAIALYHVLTLRQQTKATSATSDSAPAVEGPTAAH